MKIMVTTAAAADLWSIERLDMATPCFLEEAGALWTASSLGGRLHAGRPPPSRAD